MIPSMYNIVAPTHDGNGYILFNAKNQACVILSKDELEAYEGVVSGAVVEGEFFDQLVSLGFMTADRKTELGSMRHEFERKKFDNGMLELRICPTLDFDREGDAFGIRRQGVMPKEVQNRLADFVREQYEFQPFTTLKVVWIISSEDLTKGLDAVEYLSGEFSSFINGVGMQYRASIMTIGDVSHDVLYERLSSCEFDEIESAEECQCCLHTVKQPSANEDFVIDIAEDEVKDFFNQEECVDLRDASAAESGNVSFQLGANLTNFDAAKAEKEAIFKKRAMALLDDFLMDSPTREDFEVFLTPLRAYCGAAPERSYAIDELGNAYVCARDMGIDELVLFSVCEPVSTRKINMKRIAKYGIANPINLKECSNCRVYPLCLGGCARVRVDDRKLTCAPQRYIIEEYLTEYSRVL